MKTQFILILTIITCLSLYSCKEETISGNPPGTDDFPNTQGTSWNYRVTDSINNTTEDLAVVVGGKTNISTGDEVTVWQLSFPDTVDSNYVLIRQDTVKILENKEFLIQNIKLVFPLRVGAGWRGDYITDTFYVTGTAQVSVPAGDFNNVFVIERYYGGFNEYNRMTIWFVPGIGIIKMNKRDALIGFQIETRELTAYHIE